MNLDRHSSYTSSSRDTFSCAKDKTLCKPNWSFIGPAASEVTILTSGKKSHYGRASICSQSTEPQSKGLMSVTNTLPYLATSHQRS